MGTPEGTWFIPSIIEKATVFHHQQVNKKHGEARQISENAAATDKALNHQVIETIEYNYISELYNKYMGFMGVKAVYLVHYIMEWYGITTETDLKDNHKRFDEALDTTMPIEKYSEIIDDCIQYADDIKQP